MTYHVRMSTRAFEDLAALEDWIAERAGHDVARGYIDRLETRIRALCVFPMQGTPRNDLIVGFRTITFERKSIIAYRVDGRDVWIERVVSARRGAEAWR